MSGILRAFAYPTIRFVRYMREGGRPRDTRDLVVILVGAADAASLGVLAIVVGYVLVT